MAKQTRQSTATGDPVGWASAFARIRGVDRRPLLVMRECHLCRGSDFALLSRALNNDRTMLLTNWFHCVRLPASVAAKEHPLHALFAGKNPQHLFLATNDGLTISTLSGSQSQSKVWKAMTGILRISYHDDPGASVKKLLKLLTEFDTLDALQAQLRRRLDRELESHGPRSKKFRRMKERFEALETHRAGLLARERKLRNLRIR